MTSFLLSFLGSDNEGSTWLNPYFDYSLNRVNMFVVIVKIIFPDCKKIFTVFYDIPT